MQIGDRIRLKRKEKGITLLEMANHLGVTEATAQRYESGAIKNLKQKTIAQISELLDTSPAYLMGWEKEPSIDEIVKESGKIISGLPPELQRIALEQLRALSGTSKNTENT